MASVKIKQKETMTRKQRKLLDKIVKELYSRVFEPAQPWPASYGATEISPWERAYGSFLQQALGMPQTAPGYTLGEPIVPWEQLNPPPAPSPTPTPSTPSLTSYQEALLKALSELSDLREWAGRIDRWTGYFGPITV